MIECPRCRTPNSAEARFCNSCGASLVARVTIQERRVVTALFADLARSTSLGERLDPEVVRSMVGRFFELATREVEARGGTVEKFSGDAVMAVFGLPTAHEDDPERAVRAAVAIRDGVAALAAQTQQTHGVALQARIGIESGEVVVGDPFGGATMATGDAMNLAARLEQLAEPTEIVVGEQAWEHVRDLVDAEPLGELAIRGRDQALPGWRIRSVAADVGRPRGVPGLEAPLTGRDEELHLLLDAAGRARQERKSMLFTILGVPGVGKSRLVREATTRLAQAGWSVVRGRCLPYGDGITYWPVAEMLRELAGIDAETTPTEAQARLRRISPDDAVAERLALALGAAGAAPAAFESADREIAWAFRRLVEQVIATGGPLLLVFEDIHWAEPQLLDLIEYAVTWTRDAPLVVVCPSRPELFDRRPAWGAGRMEAARIHLEPLSEEESRALLGALLTVEDLPSELRQRVLDRAEGNPLFVEEVVRMLIEEGIVERRAGHWYARREAADVRVPDSVEALIRARLDTLPAPERQVLQAAAVVGRVFQHSAVAALTAGAGSPAGRVEDHLEDAVLRDLITEERSPGERTFRFRHVLIRDVAYATLPKARRAELHRGVADWLRGWVGVRIDEFVEIEAYHLEQAVRLRLELEGRADPPDVERATDALHASANKALARDDARATLGFAERALALDPPPSETRLELEWLQVEALRRLGEWRRSGELAQHVARQAEAAGRKDIEGRAVLAHAGDVWIGLSSADPQRALAELARARALLTEAGDMPYLTVALELLGYGGWWTGDLEDAARTWQEMARVAEKADLPDRQAIATLHLGAIARMRGDIAGARELFTRALRQAERSQSRLTRASVARANGDFLATTVAEEEGEPLLLEAAAVLDEFGVRDELAAALNGLGDACRRRGRLSEALDHYERGLEACMEHVGYRPEAERRLAQLLLDMGNLGRAEVHALRGTELVGRDDMYTVASTKMALGLVREAQGRAEEAEPLLREAVAVLEPTDFNAWEEELSLAEFLLRAGRTADGEEWAARSRDSIAQMHGRETPVMRFVEGRLAAARAAAAERSAGPGR